MQRPAHYQVGGSARKEKQQSAAALHGLPDLKGSSPSFVIDESAPLLRFSRKMLLSPRRRANYRQPLLLVRKTIPAGRCAVRAVRAHCDVAYHESFYGATFADVPSGLPIVGYLQIVLQSSMAVFFELLCDALYGVERDTVYLESILHMPVVPFDAIGARQQARSKELGQRLAHGLPLQLADAIDDFVFEVYGLSPAERDAVRDTLVTARPSRDSMNASVRAPTAGERASFANALAASLTSVLAASQLQVFVREREDLQKAPWRLLQIDVVPPDAARPSPAELPEVDFLDRADAGGAALVTLRTSAQTWLVGLLERYALWTVTRARLLATDVIAERSARG